MSNNSSAGPLIFFGILAIFGIILLQRQSSPTKATNDEWYPIHRGHQATPATIYKNKEEWEVVRGPDRLIEKIVVHRTVTQNG